jgi:trigger factor
MEESMKRFLGVFLMSALSLAGCKSERRAANGDTVVIDFAGYMDGVQFPGGTAKSFPLRLGSGQFVPGFEDQLVGLKKGDKADVSITFPTDYHPGLAGKPVVFKVEIIEIR